MMEYRVIARTARFFAPDVINNIYLKDELEDLDEEDQTNHLDMSKDVQEKKNSFGTPDEVKSVSKKEDIEDAILVGEDEEDPSEIILNIF